MAAVAIQRTIGHRSRLWWGLWLAVGLLELISADGQIPIANDRGRREVGVVPRDQNSPLPLAKLAENPVCVDDIRKFCRVPNPSLMNDLSVLECLQNNVPEGEEINDGCQHSLWMAKKRLSNDVRLSTAVGALCRQDLKTITECNGLDGKKNFMIPCLIEHFDNATDPQCKEFLQKMESIIFSDYRLIYKFVESCESDIDKLKCGRLEDDEAKKSIHNQGDTISCLAKSLPSLEPSCRRQILRVAELQGSDYHNDRPLFLACQEDREKFCSAEKSGNGRIYRCLAAHKFDQKMSKKCREQLTLRQQLQRVDYKVNRGLTVACRVHIMSERCVYSLQKTPLSGMPEARLSVILLCLENATKFGHQLDPDCVSELVAVRKSLMEDFKLSPEIVSSCSIEIRDHCNNGLERGGQTIHCLMKAAKDQLRLKFSNGQSPPFGDACKISLGLLMKVVDVRENFNIDPVLQDACGSIVRTKCSNIRPGQGKILDCLMDLVDQPNVMTEQCKNRLMETQYFVSRDFELSPRFFKACRPAFLSACDFKKVQNFSETEQSELLLCLYRKRTDRAVSGSCAESVKQIMIDRAKSVDLDPAIESNCRGELSFYCSEKTNKNEEMDCLEEHFNELEEDCKAVVKKYVQEEDEMPEISEIFMKACEPILKDHCKDAVSGGKDAEGDSLINCLIKFKTDTDMPAKCRAGVEHHQLITLKDINLSHDFKDACKSEVQEHCSHVRTKFEVISCLSEIVRNDTLMESNQRIRGECRRLLRFELLQRSENIKFDPELRDNCQDELQKFCRNITPGKSAQISCLRRHQNELGGECRKFVFRRERQEAIDPTTDFVLMSKCKRMIKKYCDSEVTQPTVLFTCLRKNKDEEDFDKACFRVIIQRQRIRALDVRLNPELLRHCLPDIKQHCDNEYKKAKNRETDAEGMVIGCLRKKFSQQSLTESCKEHVKDMIKESALDYVQNIALAKACRTEIRDNCSQAIAIDRNDPDRGAVEACLRDVMKKSLLTAQGQESSCWKELIQVLAEDKTDIHVDTLLFRACSVDLLHVCKDVVRGEGRQMSCLVDALKDKTVKLRKDCEKALNDRVVLWDKAMQLAPPDSIGDMVEHVSMSPSRNYLLTVIFAIVGIIFVGGLFCGRVTKRMARQVKDR